MMCYIREYEIISLASNCAQLHLQQQQQQRWRRLLNSVSFSPSSAKCDKGKTVKSNSIGFHKPNIINTSYTGDPRRYFLFMLQITAFTQQQKVTHDSAYACVRVRVCRFRACHFYMSCDVNWNVCWQMWVVAMVAFVPWNGQILVHIAQSFVQ